MGQPWQRQGGSKIPVIWASAKKRIEGPSVEGPTPSPAGPTGPPGPVGGRLGEFWQYWQQLSPFIARNLKNGFPLQWTSRPKPFKAPQPMLTPDEQQAVDQEIARALAAKAISPVPAELATCFSPVFTVPKKDSSARRMIIDLRRVNQYLDVPKFKTTTFREAKQLVTTGCWMAKLDVKDAFWHLPVHPQDRQYLAFEWKGQTYRYNVAPFGLSVSPLLLAKTMRPLIGRVNSKGISCAIYVDDALLVAKSEQECREAVEQIIREFEAAGFLVNREKSVLVPTQQIVYLGVEIDSVTMTCKTPAGKLNKTRMAIRKLMLEPTWTVRAVASFLGLLNSLADSLFQARVFTSGLQQWKNGRLERDWDTPLPPTQSALADLQWWSTNLETLNGRTLLPMKTDGMLTTDASDKGWSAIWEQAGLDPVHSSAYGHFSSNELPRHIAEKEILAVMFGVQAFRSQLQHKVVHLRTDSMVVMRAVNKMGSNTQRIAKLMDELFVLLQMINLQLRATYIPSAQNPADGLSRQKPANSDWQLNPRIFQQCCEIWGRPTIDLFASHENKLLPRYISYGPQPQALSIDAFNTSWTEFSWVNPPFAVLHRTLNKIKCDGTTAIVVFPFWTAAQWINTAIELITDVPLVVNRTYPIHLLPAAFQQANATSANNPTWTTVISRMSGNDSEQKAWKSRWSKHSPDILYSALKEAVQHRGNYGPYTALDSNAILTLCKMLTSSITGSLHWAHED